MLKVQWTPPVCVFSFLDQNNNSLLIVLIFHGYFFNFRNLDYPKYERVKICALKTRHKANYHR